MITEDQLAKFEELKSKKWINQEGRSVRFLGIIDNAPYIYVVAEYLCRSCEGLLTVNEDLEQRDGYPETKLREASPYDDWPLDAKVRVWLPALGTVSYNRHFAGVSADGNPLTYADGCTSWSNGGMRLFEWAHAELAESCS